jgi:hypothetical protein
VKCNENNNIFDFSSFLVVCLLSNKQWIREVLFVKNCQPSISTKNKKNLKEVSSLIFVSLPISNIPLKETLKEVFFEGTFQRSFHKGK